MGITSACRDEEISNTGLESDLIRSQVAAGAQRLRRSQYIWCAGRLLSLCGPAAQARLLRVQAPTLWDGLLGEELQKTHTAERCIPILNDTVFRIEPTTGSE